MGARQSVQTNEINSRPRAHSSVETGVEVVANTHGEVNDHVEQRNLIAEFLNMGLSDAVRTINNNSTISSSIASSAPSVSDVNVNRNVSRLSSNGSIYSTRPTPGTSSRGTRNNPRMHASTSTSRRPDERNNRQPGHSMPFLQIMENDLKCPICHKIVPSDDVEVHLVMCFTKPVINYNEDVLRSNQGECPICLEDMEEGDTIARLPCLCIYHKGCIDEWWKRSISCPMHPQAD